MDVRGVVVGSTCNWYWLVDGLMDKGYRVHLANPSAIKRYEGLKQVDDKKSSLWLANLLRLGILPAGYIYPKEERPVRDLLRKRLHLVRHRTSHILSIRNILARSLGITIKSDDVKRLDSLKVRKLLPDDERWRAVMASLGLIRYLEGEIAEIEKMILRSAMSSKGFSPCRA